MPINLPINCEGVMIQWSTPTLREFTSIVLVGLLVVSMPLTVPRAALAQEAPKDKTLLFLKASANSADEPLAVKMSLTKSAEFLDGASMAWLKAKVPSRQPGASA